MENNISPANELTSSAFVISPQALLVHWQGHRQLTRRIIEAFPEDKLFEYSIGGMRPFAVIAMELIDLALGIQGVITGEWQRVDEMDHHDGKAIPATREALLRRWDEVTAKIDTLWAQIPLQRFQETMLAFGQYEGPVYSIILYWIDNEIHHRGQGYVYLRSLGIEPPPFWDRH